MNQTIVLDVFIKLGDKVKVTVSDEQRSYGSPYTPHEGKLGTVVSFHYSKFHEERIGYHKPGLYSQRSCANVLLDDGTLLECVSAHNIAWQDESLNEVRRAERVAAGGHLDSEYDNSVTELTWLEPLPETVIWEKDVVRVVSGKHADFGIHFKNGVLYEAKLVVDRIDYHWLLGDRPDIGVQFKVSGAYEDGTTTGQASFGATEIELVERGNFWKYHHAPEILTFADIHEEITLHAYLRKVQEIRNPLRKDLYLWTRAEALTAIREGRADAFRVSQGFFGTGPSIRVQRFDDRDLGERVRAQTLQGFADVPENEPDPENDAEVQRQMELHDKHDL